MSKRITERGRAAVLLLAFAVAYIGLEVGAYTGKSATWDEPAHLASGYAALKLGDYRLGPAHPPLLRMWAALPLLLSPGVRMDTRDEAWAQGRQWSIAHRFLYRDNDADRLLFRARFMTILLGVCLGCVLFVWAQELFGMAAAALVLAIYTLEPNLMAHAGLATTDLGLTLFYFGAAWFLWRTARQASPAMMVGLAACVALAQASKFSAPILFPVVAAGLLVPVFRRSPWPLTWGPREVRSTGRKAALAAGVFLGLLLLSWGAVWAAYGFRRVPMGNAEPFLREFGRDARQFADPVTSGLMNGLDRAGLVPRLFAQGFILSQGQGTSHTGYLLGEYSDRGWWYYFPVAFLVKTPLTVILLSLAGAAVVLIRRRRLQGSAFYLLAPPAAYLAAAIVSRVNIGLRHILPIYPFLLLMAGAAARPLLRSRGKIVLVGLLLLQVSEFLVIYPDCLAAFNLAAGGPRNGSRFLLDSNLDWGQDLPGLKRWMDEAGVRRINLSYAGTADPEYYGIDCTFLPGAPYFAMKRMGRPVLPGWVAVSLTNLYGVHYAESVREFYRPLRGIVPRAVIGHSINVYWLEKPWWGGAAGPLPGA